MKFEGDLKKKLCGKRLYPSVKYLEVEHFFEHLDIYSFSKSYAELY